MSALTPSRSLASGLGSSTSMRKVRVIVIGAVGDEADLALHGFAGDERDGGGIADA